MPRAQVGELELAYEIHGEGEPMLLIMGLGAQRVFWPERLVRDLNRRGFQTVLFDNRDVGESTILPGRPPRVEKSILRFLAGMPVEADYTLEDMARDAVGLLDALSIDRAHVVGASLGGMIAQSMAIHHEHRMLSMTSIMSGPGGRRHMIPYPRALRVLAGPAPRTRQQAIQRVVDNFRVIGSPRHPLDEDELRAAASLSYDRGLSPRGFVRQLTAALASPPRGRSLARVGIPSLVIHGGVDPLIRPPAGRATARAIPGAELLVLPEMGHDLPDVYHGEIAGAIERVARRARRHRVAS